MIDSASAVLACARAVIQPTHPRRTAKGRRAGCPGWAGWHPGWRSGAAERVQASAGGVESVIYEADERRHALPVLARVAPQVGVGFPALEPQVQVVLPGEADAAMDLQRGGGHAPAGV